MAKIGEEILPEEPLNGVEPFKKIPDVSVDLSSPPKQLDSKDLKSGGAEKEEKGAAKKDLAAPAIIVTPATPEVKNNAVKGDKKIGDGATTTEKKSEEVTNSEPAGKTENENGKTKSQSVPQQENQTSVDSSLKQKPVDMSSKKAIRVATWKRLEAGNHVLFPRPCKYRIPRFKGENDAVEKLAELDVFKKAKLVKVNLDKAQEKIRLEIIQSGKELVAGTPGLREAVFLVMHPPMEPDRSNNRKAASRIGIHHLGIALDFQAKQADLVILGSVAVDMKGHRIGKGQRFSDLEFALLSKLGTIPPDACIVTLVHDAQVYDEFPESIFQPFDVPVDIIITPTRVIHVEKKLERPTLRWDFLTKRRVDNIPIIRQLLDKERANGVQIELKEVDSDTESIHRFPVPRRRNPQRPQRRQASAPETRGPIRGQMRRETSAPPPDRGTRTFRRRPRRLTSTSVDSPKSERQNNRTPSRRGPIRRINKPRYTVDFSVKVKGLSTSVRIRDLKAALTERGVRPSDISWRATKGVALLHFAKRRPIQEPKALPDANANDIVATLQGLSVKPEDGPAVDLSVEVAQPLSGPPVARIEATAV